MENVFELSYVGSPKGLMDYIKSKIPFCNICNDTGEVEIMGDGDNFEWDVVEIKRCSCQED